MIPQTEFVEVLQGESRREFCKRVGGARQHEGEVKMPMEDNGEPSTRLMAAADRLGEHERHVRGLSNVVGLLTAAAKTTECWIAVNDATTGHVDRLQIKAAEALPFFRTQLLRRRKKHDELAPKVAKALKALK